MMTMYLNRDGKSWVDDLIRDCIQPDVFNEPIIRDAMEDIEEIYKIEGLAFYSKRHGVKSPESLSNGMKMLILCYYNAMGKHDCLLCSASMGDNCMKYLARLSLKYDFNISVDYYLRVPFDEKLHFKDFDTGEEFTDTMSVWKFYDGKEGVYDLS